MTRKKKILLHLYFPATSLLVSSLGLKASPRRPTDSPPSLKRKEKKTNPKSKTGDISRPAFQPPFARIGTSSLALLYLLGSQIDR
ncbi:hypothetical protein B0T24DRAFT_634052 [Lasiosphaeria ovina]|uniref:Secreted protein n=1 Tax=Lasiosphaeria ovina TaxID=92902 RepID=A0AAE0N1N5_9PEZI|nr:hypothetical protein B0T24DRAFT_634052 [Lasiosphaeria ovina]